MDTGFKIMTLNELISLNRKIRKNKKIVVDLSGTDLVIIKERNTMLFGM